VNLRLFPAKESQTFFKISDQGDHQMYNIVAKFVLRTWKVKYSAV